MAGIADSKSRNRHNGAGSIVSSSSGSSSSSSSASPSADAAGRETVIIYCPGFLTTGDTTKVYLGEAPPATRIIGVNPSSVCSMHDRVMQIFYEIKGGTVHFGKEHAEFHGHAEEGRTYATGLYEEWDAQHPIHLIGHSFGGVTVRALSAYLAQGHKFRGHTTSASWVISVNAFSAPLNGVLRVYNLGASLGLAPVVRWGSLGCIVGWLVHVLSFCGKGDIFQAEHWQIDRSCPGAVVKLVKALCGFAIHSSTDNSAYDMTLHSQLEWCPQLALRDDLFYSTLSGTSYTHAPFASKVVYTAMEMLLREVPLFVLGIDCSAWMAGGYDGLLSLRTQQGAFLNEERPDVIVPSFAGCCRGKRQGIEKNASSSAAVAKAQVLVRKGVVYSAVFEGDHTTYSADAWRILLETIAKFQASYYAGTDSVAIAAAATTTASTTSTPTTTSSSTTTTTTTTASTPETPAVVQTDTKIVGATGNGSCSGRGSSRNVAPDMQVPRWSISARPYVTPSRIYGSQLLGEILLLGAMAIILSVTVIKMCSGPENLTGWASTELMSKETHVVFAICAVGALIIAAYFAPCTDMLECLGATLRLLVPVAIVPSLPPANTAASTLFSGILMIETVFCCTISRRKRRDFTFPLHKCIIAFILAGTRTDSSPISDLASLQVPTPAAAAAAFWISACSCDLALLLCKLPWALLSNNFHQSHITKFAVLGTCLISCIICHAVFASAGFAQLAVLDLSVPIPLSNVVHIDHTAWSAFCLRACYAIVFIGRIRDMSDAFQTHAIQLQYKGVLALPTPSTATATATATAASSNYAVVSCNENE